MHLNAMSEEQSSPMKESNIYTKPSLFPKNIFYDTVWLFI